MVVVVKVGAVMVKVVKKKKYNNLDYSQEYIEKWTKINCNFKSLV